MQLQGTYTVLRQANDTNYEVDLGHRVTCLHINLLTLWNERENVVMVNVVMVEEKWDSEQ